MRSLDTPGGDVEAVAVEEDDDAEDGEEEEDEDDDEESKVAKCVEFFVGWIAVEVDCGLEVLMFVGAAQTAEDREEDKKLVVLLMWFCWVLKVAICGIELVTTTSLIGDSSISFNAFPVNRPCVAQA